jgi:hypothetical protein
VRKLLVEELVEVGGKQTESADVGCDMPSYAVRYDSTKEKLFSHLDIDHARQNPSYVNVPENKSIIKKRASSSNRRHTVAKLINDNEGVLGSRLNSKRQSNSGKIYINAHLLGEPMQSRASWP